MLDRRLAQLRAITAALEAAHAQLAPRVKRLYNVHHSPQVVHNSEPAVMPGQPYGFPADADMGDLWSEHDPSRPPGQQPTRSRGIGAHTDPAEPEERE
jgi:hypothetical protein